MSSAQLKVRGFTQKIFVGIQKGYSRILSAEGLSVLLNLIPLSGDTANPPFKESHPRKEMSVPFLQLVNDGTINYPRNLVIRLGKYCSSAPPAQTVQKKFSCSLLYSH